MAAVMWGESSLAWFAGGAIFHLTQAPLKFSLFFCLLSASPAFPFLSYSSSDLYMSQDMNP